MLVLDAVFLFLSITDDSIKERRRDEEQGDFKSSVKHIIQAVKELVRSVFNWPFCDLIVMNV